LIQQPRVQAPSPVINTEQIGQLTKLANVRLKEQEVQAKQAEPKNVDQDKVKKMRLWTQIESYHEKFSNVLGRKPRCTQKDSIEVLQECVNDCERRLNSDGVAELLLSSFPIIGQNVAPWAMRAGYQVPNFGNMVAIHISEFREISMQLAIKYERFFSSKPEMRCVMIFMKLLHQCDTENRTGVNANDKFPKTDNPKFQSL